MGILEELTEEYIQTVRNANIIDDAITKTERGLAEMECFVPLVDVERLKLLRKAMVLSLVAFEDIFKSDFGVDVEGVIDEAQRKRGAI